MKHRVLLYRLSHTILAIDITDIGFSNEAFPDEGKLQMVPSLRFRSWNNVQRYLESLGADQEIIESGSRIQRNDFAVLTIV